MPKLLIPSLRKKYAPKQFSIKELYHKRNDILVLREFGGLGDILMHRMMFEDFKKLSPDFKIFFACPKIYHEALEDHPYIDCLLDSKDIEIRDFIISYNTSTACCRYEERMAPLSGKHRSDIWANHCGVELHSHDMNFRLPEEVFHYGRKIISEMFQNDKPTVVYSPISAMISKNIPESLSKSLIEDVKDMGFNVLTIHSKPILGLMSYPNIYGKTIKQWMGIISAADYAISVDTSTFHFSGGIKKPTVGVFTFADGKVYGKYYPNHELVQKHRDDGNWSCGPCYNISKCTKSKLPQKPCLTEITKDMILDGFLRLLKRFPTNKKVNIPIKLDILPL